jgi:hypothetical protein
MTDQQPTETLSRPVGERLRRYGLACIASAVLGLAAGLVTLAYDPAVPNDQWSYPFTTTTQWMVSVVLAGTHVLTALGFTGVLLARPYGASRAAAVTLRIAVAGFWLLGLSELLSGAIGGQDLESSAAAWVGTLFGISSLMTALGGLVAGTVIVRAHRWTGLGAWMVLASGVVMIALVIPANAIGEATFRTVALCVWSLAFLPLGRTLMTSSVAESTTQAG